MGWQKKARLKLAQALCKAAGECKVPPVSDNALCARLCLAIVCTGGWLDTLLRCNALHAFGVGLVWPSVVKIFFLSADQPVKK